MQTEIEFRGISKETQDYVYGCLLIYDDKFYVVPKTYSSKAISYFEVEPDSVGQYSGLKDKNDTDTKIYSGDEVYLAGYGDYVTEFPFTELYEAYQEGDIIELKTKYKLTYKDVLLKIKL